MIKRTLVKRAKKKAEQSRCKMKVAALGLNRDGVCVSAATNRTRINRTRLSRKGAGLHAEEIIFATAKRKGVVKIIICRTGKSGNLLPIDPCERCASIAKKLGIKIETIPLEED